MRTSTFASVATATCALACALAFPSCKGSSGTPAAGVSAPAAANEKAAAQNIPVAQPPAQEEEVDPIFKAPPDVAAPPADAQKTASGLAWKTIKAGTGAVHPKATDAVKVNYTGWTTDGKMFDSSLKRGKAAVFTLNKVIAGWTEGLQLMVAGQRCRLWIPEELAYKGRPDRPQGMLVFDVELLEVFSAPETPADVAKPPKAAKKTKSGLAWVVLQKGTGAAHPKADSFVTVHYTGWTTDGKMFDSSVTRGAPATFGLGDVIPGWTEGLQLLVAGEKARLWIPEELAYKGMPGRPQGMLVFDVELISFQ